MPEDREPLEQISASSTGDRDYTLRDGIFLRRDAVVHDGEQYDARGFRVLTEDIQRHHFWHRGRRGFLRQAVLRHLQKQQRTCAKVIDLGGGCGGWVDYLQQGDLFPSAELALADSSLQALKTARGIIGEQVSCFQVDLLDLRFDARWDVAFMLDVIEHLDDDVAALANARRALRPGGLLFVTVPALDSFWSWNDEVVKHKRRYNAERLRVAGQRAGLTPLDTRYFMFLLSPLLAASRQLKQPRLDNLDEDAQWALIEKTHAMPPAAINQLLAGVFGLEAPLSRLFRFPWGTSLLGVFRRAD